MYFFYVWLGCTKLKIKIFFYINIKGNEMDIFRGGLFLLLVVTMYGCSSSGISDLSKRNSSSTSVQPIYEVSKAFADIPIATNDSVDIKSRFY